MKNRAKPAVAYCNSRYLSIFDDWNKTDGVYCWAAGGVVRDFFVDKHPRDVDVYFSTPQDRDLATKFLVSKGFTHTDSWRKHGDHGARGHDSLIKDDLIYETFYTQPKPTLCIDEFDFTVCACAVDNKGGFFSHNNFFEHLEKKQLHRIDPGLIDHTSSAIRELNRLQDFLSMGYTIDNKNLLSWLRRTINIDVMAHKRWERIDKYVHKPL